MESIIDYLKRKLREAGPARWEPIAERVGCAKTLPRKIAYGDRENPGVETIQPLLTFFQAVERGEGELPEPAEPAKHELPEVPSPIRRAIDCAHQADTNSALYGKRVKA
jgi:hypothetical protein